MKAKQATTGVAGGVFLIGLGILLVTGDWYPGILFVVGLAAGAERAMRGAYAQAVAALAVCFAIGLLSAAAIPWHIFAPFILISLGAVAVTKGILAKEQ